MSNATDWVIALSKYIPLSAFLSHSDLPDHADDELDIDWEAVLYSTVVDYIVTALVLVATVALGWLGWNYAGRGDLARAAEARRKRKEETERWEAEEREAREAARLAEKLARRTKRAEELGVALEDLPDSEAEEEEEEEDDFEGDEEFDPEAEEDERGMPTADSGIHLPLRRRRRRPNPSTPNGQISPLSAASSSPDFHHTPTPIPKGTPRGTLDPSGEDDLDDRDHGYPDDPNYQGGQQHAQGGSEGNYIDVHLTRHVYPAPPQPVMGPGGMMYYPQHGGMVGYPGQPGQGGFGGIQLTVGGGGGRPPAVLRLDDHFPMPHPSPPGARGAPAGYLPAPYPPGYPQYPPPPGGMWMDQHGYPVDSQGYPIQGYEDGYDYDYDYTGEGYEPGSDVAEVVAGPPPGAGASPARTTSAPSSTEMSSGVESGPLGSVKGALSEHGSGRIRPESGQSVRFAEGTEVEGKEREKDAKEGKSTASSRLRAETNAARARQQERERDRDSANRNRSRSRSRSRPPQTSRNLGTVGNGRTTPGGRTSRQSGMEQREGDGDVSDGGGSAVSASRAGKGKKAANGGVNGNTSGKLGLAGGSTSPTSARSDHRRHMSTASASSVASARSHPAGATKRNPGVSHEDFDATPAPPEPPGRDYVPQVVKGHLPTSTARINEALLNEGEVDDGTPRFETSGLRSSSPNHVPQILQGHLPTNPNRLNEMLLQDSSGSGSELPRFDVSSAGKDDHTPAVVKGRLPTSAKRIDETFAGGLRDYAPTGGQRRGK